MESGKLRKKTADCDDEIPIMSAGLIDENHFDFSCSVIEIYIKFIIHEIRMRIKPD